MIIINEYETLWNDIVNLAEKNYDEQTFLEIFATCKFVKFEKGFMYISVPSPFIQTKLNRFHNNKINEFLTKLTSENIKVKFLLPEEIVEETVKEVITQPKITRNNLGQNFQFTNFVVGPSNNFAFRLAIKTADQPGEVANPLYIFGSVGLGKTHLMQAIGNYILDTDVEKQVLYIKADQFIEDYSNFCKNEMPEFNDKYRNLDVLLIDDIQVLEIGQKSQLEFFKLFDILYSNNKQIVITSDRPASELKLMDRLTSRFQAGLTVDIQTPNLEHRVEILKRKVSESTELVIEDTVLEFIASSFPNNIRELEGAFTRVLFFCTTCDIPLTLENAQEALTPLLSNRKMNVTSTEANFTQVQDVVASYYNITMDDLMGLKRQAKIVLGRHMAMYILKKKYGLSYKKIGQLFTNRDHTTVMSACDRINNELDINAEIKLAYDTITKKLE